MRKIYTLQSLFIALICLLSVSSAKAEVAFWEEFDYPIGNLYQQGDWVRYAGHTVDPIQVVNTPLSYPGYQDNISGKAVKLGSTSAQGEDLQKPFLHSITEGNIYIGALMNFEATGTNYFLTLADSVNAGFKDGGNGSEKLRLIATEGSSPEKIKFQIARGNSDVVSSDEEFDLNTTLLVILKYEFKGDLTGPGTDDDITLFINPDLSNGEPTTYTAKLSGDGYGSDIAAKPRGAKSLQLKQGATFSKTCPVVTIDQLRVATTWEELFPGGDVPPAIDKPTIIPQKNTIDMGYPFSEDIVTQTINIKAEHLTGDITVGGISGELQASATTITKEEAMSEEGFDLTLTLTANAEGGQSQTLILSSEGAETVSIPVTWYTTPVINVENLAELRELVATATEYDLFRIKNEVAISHITKDNIYIQDETSAFAISDVSEMLTTTYTSGDRIKNLIGNATKAFGQSLFYPIMDFGAPIRNEAVEPTVTTLAQMQATPVNYESRLVRVNDVTFLTTGTFSTSQIDIEQEGTTAKLSIFANSDFIGNEIPAKADLIGISRSSSNINIAPRSSEDIIVNIPDGIESVSAADKVWSTHNTLHVATVAPKAIEIFNILGKQIVRQEVSGEASFALPGGVYLVKIGAQTGKYIVK